MFRGFKAKDKLLTTLDLGAPTPRKAQRAPDPVPKPEAKVNIRPPVLQVCLAQTQTVEGTYAHFTGARRKFEVMASACVKPEILFYVVFPQQGLSHSLTTSDGLKTIVPIFTSKCMAESYISAKKFGAVAAGSRIEDLPRLAGQWGSSGINSYTLNTCCKCFSIAAFPISELQSQEMFLNTWRLDLANRRQFAESTGRNANAVLGTNPKQARAWLEGIRDHIDPANPYLHWVIAVLAGIAGDMQVNADSIKRLDAFGPPFAGKLQGTSFDPMQADSQLRTMSEAAVGLGISLGYLDATKLAQQP